MLFIWNACSPVGIEQYICGINGFIFPHHNLECIFSLFLFYSYWGKILGQDHQVNGRARHLIIGTMLCSVAVKHSNLTTPTSFTFLFKCQFLNKANPDHSTQNYTFFFDHSPCSIALYTYYLLICYRINLFVAF